MGTIKKLIGLLIISSVLLAGCGSLQGTVAEKAEASFILEVSSDDSRQPPSEEIHLTDHTVFSGAINTFEELEVGDRVEVAPFNTSPEIPYFLAARVIVE
ncbi:hypothetical protein [Planococcus maitriensis]|uniref:hypothetical protein n=1 Tax=Planococcus maitriensis TaxID=221799 RepID=UPI0011BF9EFB|nr:hypothetical protein [Planococcus maitriensis]